MLLFNANLLKQVNNTLSTLHADEIIPPEGEMLLWSSTDDVDRLYESYGYCDSGAYALSVSTDGNAEKKLMGKGESIYILPFYHYYIS